MKAKTSRELQDSVDKLVLDIRKYVSTQKEFWQRVPWLALQADGRTGFNQQYSLAYERGFWVVGGIPPLPISGAYVDLASGDLVQPHNAFVEYSLVPAMSGCVIHLAKNLNELDARNLLQELALVAKQPYPSYYDPELQEVCRARRLKQLKLKKIYTRESRESRRSSQAA